MHRCHMNSNTKHMHRSINISIALKMEVHSWSQEYNLSAKSYFFHSFQPHPTVFIQWMDLLRYHHLNVELWSHDKRQWLYCSYSTTCYHVSDAPHLGLVMTHSWDVVESCEILLADLRCSLRRLFDELLHISIALQKCYLVKKNKTKKVKWLPLTPHFVLPLHCQQYVLPNEKKKIIK